MGCVVFSNLCMHHFSIPMSFMLGCMVLSLQCFFIGCQSRSEGSDIQVLNVGEELKEQILPLKMGQGVYNIHGVKGSQWYEVKISYPASIPASFSLQVKNNAEDFWFHKNRRLLNTEKLIFKNSGLSKIYVLVTVEPAGIVAKPGVQESEIVLFNIVCDELSLGIPHKAWWVGTAAVLCLIVASIIPYFFPLQQLLKVQTSQSSYSTEAKAS